MERINYDELLNNYFKDINEDEYYYFAPSRLYEDYSNNKELDRERTLKRVDYLLSLNNKKAYQYLWNKCSTRKFEKTINLDEVKIYGTNRVYDFYTKRIKARVNSKNINLRCFGNKDIVGDQIYLTAGTEDDARLVAYHFKADGDFVQYTNTKCSKSTIDYQVSLFFDNQVYIIPPTIAFAIKDKITNQMVGFIDLHAYYLNTAYELAYYIFKPYRRKGYALEAIKLISKAAFDGKLYYPVRSLLDDVVIKKKFTCDLIRATPNEDNFASNELLKNVGYRFVGTNYLFAVNPITKKKFSSNIYVLEK